MWIDISDSGLNPSYTPTSHRRRNRGRTPLASRSWDLQPLVSAYIYISLSPPLSLHLSIYLSIYLYVYVYVYIYIYLLSIDAASLAQLGFAAAGQCPLPPPSPSHVLNTRSEGKNTDFYSHLACFVNTCILNMYVFLSYTGPH